MKLFGFQILWRKECCCFYIDEQYQFMRKSSLQLYIVKKWKSTNTGKKEHSFGRESKLMNKKNTYNLGV